MKKALHTIGGAILYILTYTMIQNAVGFFAVLFKLLTDLMKYPALTTINQEKAMDLLLKMASSHIMENKTILLLIGNLLALTLVWIFLRIRKKSLIQVIHLTQTKPNYMVIAFVIGCSVPFCVTIMNSLIPYSEEILQNYDKYASSIPEDTGFLPFLAVAVIGPFSEEVFYRGLVYRKLKKGMNILPAMLLSSAFFGLGHSGVLWFFSAFLAGLLLAWVFEMTHSLWPCILIHMLNNALAFLVIDKMYSFPNCLNFIMPVVLAGALAYLWKCNQRNKQTQEDTPKSGLEKT